MTRTLSLGSLRLALLAAAGLGVASCDNGERVNPVGHGGELRHERRKPLHVPRLDLDQLLDPPEVVRVV